MAGGNAIIRCQAISKPFLLTYPDGSKRHIDRETRDSLLTSLSIRETGFRKYKYTAKPIILRSLSDLSKLSVATEVVRRFLAGSFMFEHRGRKQFEVMETPEGMTIRLAKDGVIA